MPQLRKLDLLDEDQAPARARLHLAVGEKAVGEVFLVLRND
jgi:hypothetical protein